MQRPQVGSTERNRAHGRGLTLSNRRIQGQMCKRQQGDSCLFLVVNKIVTIILKLGVDFLEKKVKIGNMLALEMSEC